jgi:hypothetical protein
MIQGELQIPTKFYDYNIRNNNKEVFLLFEAKGCDAQLCVQIPR